jgi:hypothetical protein
VSIFFRFMGGCAGRHIPIHQHRIAPIKASVARTSEEDEERAGEASGDRVTSPVAPTSPVAGSTSLTADFLRRITSKRQPATKSKDVSKEAPADDKDPVDEIVLTEAEKERIHTWLRNIVEDMDLPDNEISWEPAAAPVRPLERQMSQMTHGSHASVSAVSTMGGGS